MRFAHDIEKSLTGVLDSHALGKLVSGDPTADESESPKAWTSVDRKLYERFPYRTLQVQTRSEEHFDSAIAARTSTRVFDPNRNVPLEIVSGVICSALRDIHRGTFISRPYPSAGGRYPTEVYLIAQRIVDLPYALYHFDPSQCRLCTLFTDGASVRRAEQSFLRTSAADPAGILVFSSVLPRICVKYGARGYRFALLEVGAACALVDTAFTMRSLSTVWIGGFIDDALAGALGISIETELEVPLIALAFGYAL